MRFSCIIPAYNEGPRIGKIIEKVIACALLDEIIIVNDGSTDNTQGVIDSFTDPRLKKIHLPKNQGKLAAFFQGIDAATGDQIFMVDADYSGFRSDHISELIEPIQSGETESTMMMWYESFWICKIFKHDIFSGTRVLPKSVFDDREYFFQGNGFALETRINEILYQRKLTVKSLYFPEVHNPPKGWKQMLWKQPNDILRVTSPWRLLQHIWYIYRQQ